MEKNKSFYCCLSVNLYSCCVSSGASASHRSDSDRHTHSHSDSERTSGSDSQ